MVTGRRRGDHGVLEGNWVEEMALRETAHDGSQQTITTFQRVLGHRDSPAVATSTTADALRLAAAANTETASKSYRYLRQEALESSIWSQAVEQFAKATKEQADRQAQAMKSDQFGGRRAPAASLVVGASVPGGAGPTPGCTTLYNWPHNKVPHCGYTRAPDPRNGHGRSSRFSQPISEYVRGKEKE
ncbi:Uncharacterized protein PBTT_03361 [Plasmodiophora brassicae]